MNTAGVAHAIEIQGGHAALAVQTRLLGHVWSIDRRRENAAAAIALQRAPAQTPVFRSLVFLMASGFFDEIQAERHRRRPFSDATTALVIEGVSGLLASHALT